MPDSRAVIDVTNAPELLRLAEDVRSTGESRVLRRNGEDLAVVMPVSPAQNEGRRRVKTAEDLAAFRAAAGSWNDFDLDHFVATVGASRI